MDKWIPGDVSVGVHVFATHISPLHFKNPREFHPERWLGDAEYADDHFGAMEAFSVGPRNCLGKNLAWHEARLLLATLLLHFDVSLAEGVARVDTPAAVYAVGEAAIDGQPSQGIARVTANLTPLQEFVIDLPDIAPCIGSSNFDRVIIMIVLLCPWRHNVVPRSMSGISDYRPETLVLVA